jgi:integrase
MIHTVIHKSLGQAVKPGAISHNPAQAPTPPRYKSRNKMKMFTEAEIGRLLVAAKNTRHEALFHLALATGMRQAELLGLQWVDLDWGKQSLRVQRQLKKKFTDGDYYDSPKTKSGNRTIILGGKTIEVLRMHQSV